MFTGIIEEFGEIVSVTGGSKLKDLIIRAKVVSENIKLGQSISVNGVCLTVTEILSNGFKLQVGQETLKTTNLGELRTGNKVHLERGMMVGSRFDGHIVQGHVDGTAELSKKHEIGENLELTIKYPEKLGAYFIEKGSIALDGVSLTIQSIDRKSNLLSVFLIPHTIRSTLFSGYREGKILNIEVDVVGKYIHSLMSLLLNQGNEEKNTKNLSMDFLAKQGYL